jgi:hypothetical protein
MAHWTDSADAQESYSDEESSLVSAVHADDLVEATPSVTSPEEVTLSPVPEAPSRLLGPYGWPVPSSLCPDAENARASIKLPEFDALLLEKARVISSRFPFAEAEYRSSRSTAQKGPDLKIPHFERVFRIAAALASVPDVQEASDYDVLLILTAWQTVRPGVTGFLGSYPKALLCPLSHAAPPTALARLSRRERAIFERRAPIYLRYLLCDKFGLHTCADLENADLRHLFKSTGFRLIRSSAAAEIAFPGITRGEDPPVRPWKLTLRQELTDERAVDLLMTAALWQIKHGLQLVSFENGQAQWNIGAFGRTDWEDAFLSLGVRVPPALQRESGLIDWRAILTRCIRQIGQGNLPADVLGKVSAWPQRVCHDSHQAIWGVLDNVARNVMDQVRASEPQLFDEDGGLHYETARSFRRWARLFDEVSPQILSRFGVSAFTALRRVASEYFGWRSKQLKPWDLEQEHGKWKGPRGRALLKSAYAYALYENGLGYIYQHGAEIVWHCTLKHFAEWYPEKTEDRTISPYDFLYGIASRHGLTPLLNRDVSHTAAVSLLAGMKLHEHLPKIEGCWEVCMRTAIERHGGKLDVHLPLPDLVPLPLRMRKALLTPLSYSYLHKELRFVRDFDLRTARETHRKLEEIPGWWEDERIIGTPLEHCLKDPSHPARATLEVLQPDPWLEPQKLRFRALHLLTSKRATTRTALGETVLSSEEIRALLQMVYDSAMPHTNIMRVSFPAIRRGFERILAREDTREMLDSLLLHVGTAYETEVWGRVRKFIVLDVINDLVALTIRSSLLHLMSAE